MEDEEDDENLLLGRDGHGGEVGLRVKDARELRLRVHALPQVAMRLGQLDEVSDTPGTGLKKKGESDDEECPRNQGGLDKRKPIMTNPVAKPHASIIPSQPDVS